MDRYIANVDSIEINSTGDLCAIQGRLESECTYSAGPRKHRFSTNNLGYKTDSTCRQAGLIIAGDSFLAASGGDDMDQMLGSVLGAATGLDICELAHPGNTLDYQARISALKRVTHTKIPYVLLVYEGNDLNSKNEHLLKRLIKRIPVAALLKTQLSIFSKDDARVTVSRFRNGEQAFYKESILASNADGKISNLDWFLSDDSFCGVWLVPTSYSVMKEQKPTLERHPSLQSQVNMIIKSGREFKDLREPLKTHHDKGHLIWWKDDTHWNHAGIKIAADYLLRTSKYLLKA